MTDAMFTTHHKLVPVPKGERGAVLVLVAFTVLLVFVLSNSLFEHGMAARSDVERARGTVAALQLAEQAVAVAELELMSQSDRDGDGLGSVAGMVHNGGSWEATATPIAGTSNRYKIESVGRHGLSVRRIEVGVTVTTSFAFRHAVFARDALDIDSSVATDSYDSTDGTWASQAKNNDALGWYADPTGHVGSNGDIDIYSSVRVRGDARSGPTSTTEIHGGSAVVYGDDSQAASVVSVPDPDLADFEAAFLDNNNGELKSSGDITYHKVRMNLRVDGSDTLNLSGGTYFFNDFELNSSSTLHIMAPTTIYVTGDLLLTSSVAANANGRAADLSFIVHPYALSPGWAPPSSRIELNSSLRAALTIYAPARDVYMDSSVHLYGAIVGKSVEANGSVQIHYDRALGSGGAGRASVTRSYWREPGPPRR
jgi:hypothetical protein